MIEEAQLERVASGLAPVTPGWFVVNTADAAWVTNDDWSGGVCIFESDEFVLREGAILGRAGSLAFHHRTLDDPVCQHFAQVRTQSRVVDRRGAGFICLGFSRLAE